jgi:hypothetical protein
MTSTNTHLFFCCETDCGAEAPVYGGHCYLCSCAEKWREASEGLHTCEKRGKESCIPCAFNAPLQEHKCSGEFVDDGFSEYYVCDYADSPRCPQRCPQNKPSEKYCTDCGVQRKEVEPVLNCAWYCKPCWKTRFTQCTDCGTVPKNGFFTCYRGEEPLCADCEEAAYGPPSPVDWRDRTGRCSKCDFFYDIHCSSDRRDLCYKCQ